MIVVLRCVLKCTYPIASQFITTLPFGILLFCSFSFLENTYTRIITIKTMNLLHNQLKLEFSILLWPQKRNIFKHKIFFYRFKIAMDDVQEKERLAFHRKKRMTGIFFCVLRFLMMVMSLILVIKVLRQKEVCSQILVLLTGKVSLYH